MNKSIAIIGPGRVGSAIAHKLYLAGYQLCAIVAREAEKAVEACRFIGCSTGAATTNLKHADSAGIILLTVPDDQIATSSAQLQEAIDLSNKVLIHCSGLHPAEVMKPAAQASLSIHPLLPFADRQMAVEGLNNCPCALEGDEDILVLGEELICALGGRPFRIDSQHKALYHTAACVASNHLVALLDQSMTLMGRCGIPEGQCFELIAPLIEASVANIGQLGTEQGLTGPVVRGDKGTVSSHIDALAQAAPEQLNNYIEMATQTLALAKRSQRLSDTKREKLQQLLEAQKNLLTQSK